MIRTLVKPDDPILHEKLEPFKFDGEIDPSQLARDLAETMMSLNGIGLAANQIGVRARMFVIKANPILAVINPLIVDRSDQQVYLEEGCLTYPGLIVKIKRPGAIRVRYTMANGDTNTYKYSGMTARIFQHELDHLDGKVFFKRATRFHLEQAQKRIK